MIHFFGWFGMKADSKNVALDSIDVLPGLKALTPLLAIHVRIGEYSLMR